MLGNILLANGAITQEELAAEVAAKAEENIYGLFDWTDAFFRYEMEAAPDPNIIEVDFSVDEIVEKGLKRYEQLQRIRDAFSSSGIVLVRTDETTPPEIHTSALARSILESVDGRRTVAEILLHCHASEFLVLRFLYTLHRKGVVRIAEVQQVDPASSTLLDETPSRAVTEEAGGSADGEPGPSDEEGRKALERYPEVAAQLELALHFMSEGEFEGALQVLDHCYRAHPGDDYLRHLMNKAESSLLEKVRKDDLPPTKIPVRREHDGDVSELNLQPSELFLLGMIDGASDLKTLLWVAPMRELDVYTTLRQLMQRGLVELRDPESETAAPAESDRPSVRWA